MIKSYVYIDDLSLFNTGRSVIKFMMRMKANSFSCDDPVISKLIHDLGWNIKTDGNNNILNYLGEDLPKISERQRLEEKHYPNLYSRQRFYEDCIKKLEKRMNWSEQNKFNMHFSTFFS